MLFYITKRRSRPFQPRLDSPRSGNTEEENEFDPYVVAAEEQFPEVDEAGVEVNRLLPAAEEVALAEQQVLWSTATGCSYGAGPELDAFDLVEVITRKRNHPGAEAAVHVYLIRRDAGYPHGLHQAGWDTVLGHYVRLEGWPAGRNRKINDGVGDFKEPVSVSIRNTSGDEEQTRKDKTEEASDDGEVYVDEYNDV